MKIQTGNFKKQVTTAEGKAQSEKRSKVQFKNDNIQAFDSKWDEAVSAVTDTSGDSILGSLHKMQVEKSEELKYLLQVYAQETTLGDKRCDDWPNDVSSRKSRFSFQSKKTRREQTCKRSSKQR